MTHLPKYNSSSETNKVQLERQIHPYPIKSDNKTHHFLDGKADSEREYP